MVEFYTPYYHSNFRCWFTGIPDDLRIFDATLPGYEGIHIALPCPYTDAAITEAYYRGFYKAKYEYIKCDRQDRHPTPPLFDGKTFRIIKNEFTRLQYAGREKDSDIFYVILTSTDGSAIKIQMSLRNVGKRMLAAILDNYSDGVMELNIKLRFLNSAGDFKISFIPASQIQLPENYEEPHALIPKNELIPGHIYGNLTKYNAFKCYICAVVYLGTFNMDSLPPGLTWENHRLSDEIYKERDDEVMLSLPILLLDNKNGDERDEFDAYTQLPSLLHQKALIHFKKLEKYSSDTAEKPHVANIEKGTSFNPLSVLEYFCTYEPYAMVDFGAAYSAEQLRRVLDSISAYYENKKPL